MICEKLGAAVEMAERMSKAPGLRFIGPEHLLPGIIRKREGPDGGHDRKMTARKGI